MDKISIIIPVYNVKEYLERCVDSVLAQSYTCLEILLVDDGSTDGSGELCDALAAKDARICVIHQANGGLSAARNTGMDVCTGTWAMFLDSDDWIAPTMVQLLYTACCRYDVPLAECGYRDIYRDHISVDNPCTGRVLLGSAADAISGCLRWWYYRPVAVCKLYHRSVFEKVRFPLHKLHEDEFTNHLFYDAAQKTAYLDVALYHYDRTRSDSITASFKLRNLDACEAFCQKMHFIWQNPIYCELNAMIADAYATTVMHAISCCVQQHLSGPELDAAVQTALQQLPAMQQHGLNEKFIPYFDLLQQGDIFTCGDLWLQQKGA